MISRRFTIRLAQVVLILALGLWLQPPTPVIAGGGCTDSDCQDACGVDLGEGCYEAGSNPNGCRCVVWCESEGSSTTHEFPPCNP
jgi:hypothetical protein